MKPSRVIKSVLSEYFDNDLNKFLEATGYSKAQVLSWKKGEVTPQKSTLTYIFNCIKPLNLGLAIMQCTFASRLRESWLG